MTKFNFSKGWCEDAAKTEGPIGPGPLACNPNMLTEDRMFAAIDKLLSSPVLTDPAFAAYQQACNAAIEELIEEKTKLRDQLAKAQLDAYASRACNMASLATYKKMEADLAATRGLLLFWVERQPTNVPVPFEQCHAMMESRKLLGLP